MSRKPLPPLQWDAALGLWVGVTGKGARLGVTPPRVMRTYARARAAHNWINPWSVQEYLNRDTVARNMALAPGEHTPLLGKSAEVRLLAPGTPPPARAAVEVAP